MITKINNKSAKGVISFLIPLSSFLVKTLLPLSAFLVTSCADLEQTSLSSIDRDNFYQSKEDIETAINGIYQEFTVSTVCSTTKASTSTTFRPTM